MSPDDMFLCAFTPVHMPTANHIVHPNYQTELHRFLKDRFRNCLTLMSLDMDSAGVFGSRFHNKGTDEVIRLDRATGIVAPTKRAVVRMAEQWNPADGRPAVMLRITQDTRITDPEGLVKLITDRAAGRPFLVGGWDNCCLLKTILRDLNAPAPPDGRSAAVAYRYVQGNFMLGSCGLWAKWYMKMPQSVTHYRDDPVFTYMVEKSGVAPEFLCHWAASTIWKHLPRGSEAECAALVETPPDGFGGRPKAGPDISVSVIMPTCGRPTLEAAVLSLVPAGLTPADEVIIVSDGKLPGFEPRCAELGKQTGLDIRAIEGPRTHRYGNEQRNAGIAAAAKDFIMFLDDDDRYLPGIMPEVRRTCADHPGHLILFKLDHGQAGVLWNRKELICGNTSSGAIVVDRSAVRKCRWGDRYEADYLFAKDLVASGVPLAWSELIVVRADRFSRGGRS